MDEAHCVLDASALLCLVSGERGADRIEERLDGAVISAVNFAEVVSKLVERQVWNTETRLDLEELPIAVVPFDRGTAEAAGLLRTETRRAGLSLGDRCCLALAKARGATALTADRAWASVSVGVPIEIVR